MMKPKALLLFGAWWAIGIITLCISPIGGLVVLIALLVFMFSLGLGFAVDYARNPYLANPTREERFYRRIFGTRPHRYGEGTGRLVVTYKKEDTNDE